jgi:hypothetical protein
MVKFKFLSLLALLCMTVSGAWATKTELNKFWAWDQDAQQTTQSGTTYTFISDYMGGSTDVYADWSAYDYVWMKYSGLSGQINFILMYDEYVSTESYGVVFDQESVTLNSLEATSGVVRIAINKTKTFTIGGGDTGGEHIGDIYAQHVRQIRIQNPTSPSAITVEGIWVGTEADYNGAMSETYDPTKNHMLKVYNSRITGNIWDNVAQYTFATPMVAGKNYTIKMKVHAADITAPCTVRYGFIGEGTNYDTYVYGNDMTILPHTSAVFTDTYQAIVNHPTIELSMGGVIGNVYFDDVSCTLADDESVNMIGNADFETQTYAGWSAPGYTMQSFSHVEDPYTELQETTDNSTWLSGNSEPADIRLSRTLQTGGWNTFCSPFSISSTDLTAMGITAKTLSSSTFDAGSGLLTLIFADAASIEAGKPYLVKVDATVQNPTFEGVTTVSTTTTTETTYADFVPTLGLTEVTGNTQNILFVGSGNKLLHPTSLPANMKGFRSYFLLKGDAAAQTRSFSMDFGDGETTGIISIENGQTATDKAVYDLQGRRVSGTAQKGVYVMRSAEGRLQGKNGKKVIIK